MYEHSNTWALVLAAGDGSRLKSLTTSSSGANIPKQFCSLHQALDQLPGRCDETVLLGLEPEETDPELGYIVPGHSDTRGALAVQRFIEKPPISTAREIISVGGLWNAFILAALAQALLALFRRRVPDIVREMGAAVQSDRAATGGTPAMGQLYARLPALDFSRDVLPGQEAYLRVLRVPQCGWSDLGTPRRVAAALRRGADGARVSAPSAGAAYLNLAAQIDLLQAAG